jgi:hypothetical protein
VRFVQLSLRLLIRSLGPWPLVWIVLWCVVTSIGTPKELGLPESTGPTAAVLVAIPIAIGLPAVDALGQIYAVKKIRVMLAAHLLLLGYVLAGLLVAVVLSGLQTRSSDLWSRLPVALLILLGPLQATLCLARESSSRMVAILVGSALLALQLTLFTPRAALDRKALLVIGLEALGAVFLTLAVRGRGR